MTASSVLPQRWQDRPVLSQCRRGSLAESSMLASPSNMRSPVQPAWRWLVYDRSLLFTQRSYLGRGTKSSTTLPFTVCQWCSVSTERESLAPMVRAITASMTSPCSQRCLACVCLRHRMQMNSNKCCQMRSTSPMTARSSFAIRAAVHHERLTGSVRVSVLEKL